MSSSVIISACRTAVGRYLGGFASVSAVTLGAEAIRESVRRAGIDPAHIDQTIVGNVVSAGIGQAPGRQASLAAGLPDSIGAITVNKVCGSGLYAAMLADVSIRAGEWSCVVAAGMESMSTAPHVLFGGRSGWKYGPQTMQDAVDWDGLRCSMGKTSMGCYGEATAKQFGISREDQDAWAFQSHQRALAAQDAGHFAQEIVPVTVVVGKLSNVIDRDEGPRRDTSLETLAKLRPAFDPTGTVTAGNASPLSDGGAAAVVVSDSVAKSLSVPWKFRIFAHAIHAQAPSDLFIAPVGAIQKALDKARRSVRDIDLFEINEAFASQTIACQRQLDIDPSRLNISGGAIAIGHPLGCSGARVLVTLIHNLLSRDATTGIVSLCLGGGEAVAMLIERSE